MPVQDAPEAGRGEDGGLLHRRAGRLFGVAAMHLLPRWARRQGVQTETDHTEVDMNVFSKIAGWFRKLFAGTRQLFFVVWTASRKEISDALNDPELQQLALVAVRNAAYRGLTGDAAWTDGCVCPVQGCRGGSRT